MTALETFVYSQTKKGTLTKEGVYIGRFDDKDGKKRDYFTAPTDAQDSKGKRLRLNFNEAAEYAEKATDLGHTDWIVPTSYNPWGGPDILSAIFNNKSKGAFKGTFDETGWNDKLQQQYDDCRDSVSLSAWYWSSTRVFGWRDFCAQTQSFGDNHHRHNWHGKDDKLSVRLVRSIPV